MAKPHIQMTGSANTRTHKDAYKHVVDWRFVAALDKPVGGTLRFYNPRIIISLLKTQFI